MLTVKSSKFLKWTFLLRFVSYLLLNQLLTENVNESGARAQKTESWPAKLRLETAFVSASAAPLSVGQWVNLDFKMKPKDWSDTETRKNTSWLAIWRSENRFEELCNKISRFLTVSDILLLLRSKNVFEFDGKSEKWNLSIWRFCQQV